MSDTTIHSCNAAAENSVAGLALSRRFFASCRDQLLAELPLAVTDVLATGLVGEGSECFGFDDLFSRDHDWGPAFCLWLPLPVLERWQQDIERVLAGLPQEFEGHTVRMAPEHRAGRVGPLSVEHFYARFLRTPKPPQSWQEWRAIPEHHYAVCTNGLIFSDALWEHQKHQTGEKPFPYSMTAVRSSLLAYYPEDLRRKKIAARCAQMAQAGQYNLLRSLKREDAVTAALCAARFTEQALQLVHHLARIFTPFYKWATRSAACASPLGRQITSQLDTLFRVHLAIEQTGYTATLAHIEPLVEDICTAVAAELHQQGLSTATDGWLMEHAQEVQAGIRTPELARFPVLLD